MTEAYAEQISKWQYPAPYTIYSMKANDEEIDQLMNGLHRVVLNEKGELTGFLAFGWAAQVLGEGSAHIYEDESYSDIALGLKQELCGKGLGRELVKCAVSFIKELFPGTACVLRYVRITQGPSRYMSVRAFSCQRLSSMRTG